MWSALNKSLPGRIFISYRRQETAWPAGRLYDVLVEHFPAEQVVKDICNVHNIQPGEDFVEVITAAVASCDVLLALIGPQWLTITDGEGQRRLDDPEDWVRIEIETALRRRIRVIPILVDEARMPRADELPPALSPLVYRNAVEINPVTFDTRRLVATLRRTLAEQGAGPDVEQLYDQALGAFSTEHWDEAVDLLGQVVSRQPNYADAAGRLEFARREQELALRYAQASAAADASDWEQAVEGYTMIAEADPGYRDTNTRLANARQLADRLAEARRLHRAGQWAAVLKLGEQLKATDTAAADLDGLITSARAELAAAQRAAKLVFLCHSSGDKERVRRLYQRLMADGIDCWLDDERLLPGQDWEYEINRAISKSKFVLACLSKASVTKTGFVQKELKTALDAADRQPEGIAFLIPVRLEECEVPQRLSRWQWVDLFKEGGYERLVRGLKA
jgi:hypothetical protein